VLKSAFNVCILLCNWSFDACNPVRVVNSSRIHVQICVLNPFSELPLVAEASTSIYINSFVVSSVHFKLISLIVKLIGIKLSFFLYAGNGITLTFYNAIFPQNCAATTNVETEIENAKFWGEMPNRARANEPLIDIVINRIDHTVDVCYSINCIVIMSCNYFYMYFLLLKHWLSVTQMKDTR
jgi:hypothetical protein